MTRALLPDAESATLGATYERGRQRLEPRPLRTVTGRHIG